MLMHGIATVGDGSCAPVCGPGSGFFSYAPGIIAQVFHYLTSFVGYGQQVVTCCVTQIVGGVWIVLHQGDMN
jgi:hypothetical protein